MIALEVLAGFAVVSAALALAPGPDNIFVLTQSALYGRTAGLLVTSGLCTGLIVHTTAVALGIAAIFESSATAFNMLKVVGAGYLLLLAWQAFRSRPARFAEDSSSGLSYKHLYARGVIMNITNPKVAIFFLAFLPQFADPVRGSLAIQISMLGFVFILVTLLVFGSISIFAGSVGNWLRNSVRAQLALNRIAGLIFVALAIKLATANQ